MISPFTAPVSVIVPTYNRLATLPRCLGSIVQQTLLPREVIVVDDGSTDGTGNWLNSWQTKGFHKIVIKQKNAGVSQARNAGLKKATSPWIALLDSDDEWLPHKLEEQMHFVEKNPDILIIHTEEIWIRQGIRVNSHKKHQKMGGHIYLQSLPLCLISPSSVLVHQRVFEQVGRFDKNLHVCEDYDLWLRITSEFEVGYLKHPCLIKYGGHDDQLSGQYVAMDQYRVQALMKMLELKKGLKKGLKEEWEIKYKEATLSMLKRKCQILISGANKRGNERLAQEHTKILKRYT